MVCLFSAGIHVSEDSDTYFDTYFGGMRIDGVGIVAAARAAFQPAHLVRPGIAGSRDGLFRHAQDLATGIAGAELQRPVDGAFDAAANGPDAYHDGHRPDRRIKLSSAIAIRLGFRQPRRVSILQGRGGNIIRKHGTRPATVLEWVRTFPP